MFTNSDGCTVYEKITVNRAPSYVRHVFGPLYWEDVQAQSSEKTGGGTAGNPENQILCIVPADSIPGYIPKTDDRICADVLEQESPPPDALTITKVKKFLYGTDMVQHIEITAN